MFIDLEIARVKRRRPILQIAAIAISDSLHEAESFEAKLQIDERKTPAALINNKHFDQAVWRREARHPKVIAYEFARFLSRHASTEVSGANQRRMHVAQLVAHNAEFDGTFLREWFEGLGMFLPASYRVYCTLQRAYWLFQEHRGLAPPVDYRLGTLCAYFGVAYSEETSHDAVADVRATAELYRRMHLIDAARCAEDSIQNAIRAPTNGCG